MWIPEPIYQRLPWLYALAGVVILAGFPFNLAAILSASMFFGAALCTWVWRHKHRKPASKSQQLSEAARRRRERRQKAMFQ